MRMTWLPLARSENLSVTAPRESWTARAAWFIGLDSQRFAATLPRPRKIRGRASFQSIKSMTPMEIRPSASLSARRTRFWLYAFSVSWISLVLREVRSPLWRASSQLLFRFNSFLKTRARSFTVLPTTELSWSQ